MQELWVPAYYMCMKDKRQSACSFVVVDIGDGRKLDTITCLESNAGIAPV